MRMIFLMLLRNGNNNNCNDCNNFHHLWYFDYITQWKNIFSRKRNCVYLGFNISCLLVCYVENIWLHSIHVLEFYFCHISILCWHPWPYVPWWDWTLILWHMQYMHIRGSIEFYWLFICDFLFWKWAITHYNEAFPERKCCMILAKIWLKGSMATTL